MNTAVHEPAKPAGVERLTRRHDRTVEAVLVVGADKDARGVRGGNYPPRVGERQRYRLFYYHVTARRDAVKRNGGVRAAFGRHGNKLGRDLGKHFFVVGIARQRPKLEPCGKRLRFFGQKIAYRGNFKSLSLCRERGFYVVGRYPAATYKSVFHNDVPQPFGKTLR